MTCQDRQNGFTVAESLFAMAILSVCVLALFPAITAGHVQMHYAMATQQAIRLANELMERILALPYNDAHGVMTPGPEAGETGPSSYDNIDDYHGYSEAPGRLKDMAGSLLPSEYQSFSRSVTVVYGSQNIAAFGGPMPGLTITVTVRSGDGQTWTLQRFVPEPPS